MIKKEISDLLNEALKKIGTKGSREVLVKETVNPDFGDYSSNIAMAHISHCEEADDHRLTKQSLPARRQIKRLLRSPRRPRSDSYDNPRELAEEIIKHLPENEIIEKTEVAGPGFLNFWVSKKFLQNELQNILKTGGSYGESDQGKNEKVLVEFISANPTGPMHIGNARGGPLGDIIANVLSKSGYKIEREFYVNDVGRQVKLFGESVMSYIKGTPLPKDGYPGKYVQDLAKRICGRIGPYTKLTVAKIVKLSIEEMVKQMKQTAKEMGIKYDNFKNESEYLNSGKTEEIVKKLTEAGKTKEKEGALWFVDPKGKFLEDRECVLKRSKGGGYTYFANDIAYHQDKFARGFDRLIDVWGANHFGHIPRMKESMAALDHDPKKLEIILYQYVQLREEGMVKKMAKREGTYVTADEVLELVSKDVFRMMMIMTAQSSHLEFDLKLAQEQSKSNPVFYVQYAYARICNILARIQGHKMQSIKPVSADRAEPRSDGQIQNSKFKILKHKTEIALLKELIKFPDLVGEIAKNYEVHHLPFYAIELAKKFHQFYKNCRVLQAETEELKVARLALTNATQIVLKNTLDLMGIEAPEKM